MIVKLFDIQNSKVVLTEHCFTLPFLKSIMTEYPDTHMQVYQYLFYMSCPNRENPYFNVPVDDREDLVLEDLDVKFSTEDDVILEAVKKATLMYQTPTVRAYQGITTMLDNLTEYMSTTAVTAGRDGNINSMVNAAAKFEQIRNSYKGAFSDMRQEQESSVRGGQGLAYDQL